jgi:hypothetical protein
MAMVMTSHQLSVHYSNTTSSTKYEIFKYSLNEGEVESFDSLPSNLCTCAREGAHYYVYIVVCTLLYYYVHIILCVHYNVYISLHRES